MKIRRPSPVLAKFHMYPSGEGGTAHKSTVRGALPARLWERALPPHSGRCRPRPAAGSRIAVSARQALTTALALAQAAHEYPFAAAESVELLVDATVHIL